MRAWPDGATLRAVVGTAASFSGGAIDLPEFEELTVESWPSWRCGEPDVVVRLHRGGAACRVLVFEMKLGAQKSGTDDVPVAASEVTKDQLAKYQREAVVRWPRVPVTVVYLTHHATSRETELPESLASMGAPERGVVSRLAWCSWRDVEEGLVSLRAQRRDGGFHAYAEGLIAVLRSLGMFRFRGKWSGAGRKMARPAHPIWWTASFAGPRDVVRSRYCWSPPGVPSPRRTPRRERRYVWTRPSAPGLPRPFFRRSA